MNLSVYTDGSRGTNHKHGVGVVILNNLTSEETTHSKQITWKTASSHVIEAAAILYGIQLVVKDFPSSLITVYSDCTDVVDSINRYAYEGKKIRGNKADNCYEIGKLMNCYDIMIIAISREESHIKIAHNLANSARKAKK